MKRFSTLLRGTSFTFFTAPGVFSKHRVDPGTKLLIESFIVKPYYKKLLDLGCGYGVVGIAAKTFYPNLDVYLTDINERAIFLAKLNAKENKVKVKIFHGNLFEAFNFKKPFFDIILLNPPMSAGMKLCKEMISQSYEWLKDRGSLQLVARHKKGGKRLMLFMKEVFGNVETIAKKAGYHVYLSLKE